MLVSNNSVPDAVAGLCRWQSLPTAPGTRTAPHDVMCAACRRVVPFLDAMTTIPWSPVTSDPIGHGYVHCKMCAVALDATAAWMSAHQRYADKERR
jgi:hypothetical protein